MKLNINNRKGFTLIEILVVLTLTVIIMGLVFYPLTKSFELTRQAEIMVRTQDNARLALATISSDLSNAMYVYDNTRDPITFPVVDQAGNPVDVGVYFAKVDIVLPRMHGHCPDDPEHTEGGIPRGDEAAPNCPVCGVPLDLKPIEPLVPDAQIVRYFVGLEDPSRPYANGYTQRLVAAGDDNMYILYRAEFDPRDQDGILFPSGRDFNTNLSDPYFFYNSATNAFGEPFYAAWRRISRPVVTIRGTDLVRIDYSGNEVNVTPTVRFSPTAIFNDPLQPTTEGYDDSEHRDTPPVVYRATYGHWVLPYQVVLSRAHGGVSYKSEPFFTQDGRTHMGVFRGDVSNPTHANCIFDITHYENTRAQSQFGAGIIRPTRPEMAFTVDANKGTVNFAFPVVNEQASNTHHNAISMIANTDDINAEFNSYDSPYRRLVINSPLEQRLGRSTVVPGSARVTAPDATFSRTFGSSGLYTRIPFLLYEPGPNQYTVDSFLSDDGAGEIRFHTIRASSGQQGIPLPPGSNNVHVFYEVQNNQKGDSLRANYTTKSLMTITLGIRIYESNSGRAEVVELTNKIQLRNVRN